MTVFDPEKIFAALETQRAILVDALETKLKAEKALERAEDTVFEIHRKTGIAIEDCKRSARLAPETQKLFEEWIKAKKDYDSALYRFDNLKIFAELRRTQETSLRQMRV